MTQPSQASKTSELLLVALWNEKFGASQLAPETARLIIYVFHSDLVVLDVHRCKSVVLSSYNRL